MAEPGFIDPQKRPDDFAVNLPEKQAKLRAHIISKNAFKPESYEWDESPPPESVDNPLEVRTTVQLLDYLHRHEDAELDAKCMVIEGGRTNFKAYDRKSFLETMASANKHEDKMREGFDSFGRGGGFGGAGDTSPLVGNDFIPLMGGPFFKQLYYYNDYLKMHQASFFAYHHDPFGRGYVNLIRDFSLGRGWRVDCKDARGLAVWRAFEKANKLREMLDSFAREIAIYGENMVWKLPGLQSAIGFNLTGDQIIPQGLIPRVRLLDPSNMNEIITYPEDITRPLYYQWLTPTQYQLYGARDDNGSIPVLKFINRQIPADQILHYKVNCVSNEKRGRSDFFPVLGYMKRLRDSVNYQVIAAQKDSAWSMDTTIEGSDADLQNYVNSIQALGPMPQAGSEFAHTKAVSREYRGNSSSGSKSNVAFDWCMSMISVGVGTPAGYWGTHLSGGSTKGSALVATEPYAKKIEIRQSLYEQLLKDLADYVFQCFGLKGIEIEVTFPEVASQDRSAKLKDIFLSEDQGVISHKTASTLASKELQITEYDYDQERQDIQDEQGPPPAVAPIDFVQPLTKVPNPVVANKVANPSNDNSLSTDVRPPNQITSEDKRNVRMNRGT